MDTYANEIQKKATASFEGKTKSGGEFTTQFTDNRPENIAQLKLQRMVDNSPQVQQTMQMQAMVDNSPQVQQTMQMQAMADNSSQVQQTIQRKENGSGEVIQLNKHKKGQSRAVEARKRKNANRREKVQRDRVQEVEDAAAWSETVSDWASWAWDRTKSIGLEAVKKVTGGVDPFEVAGNLKRIYNSNAGVNIKLYYLALYGTSEVSNFLNANMGAIVGGEVGAMMEIEQNVNEHLEKLAGLWETGEIDEGQVDEAFADKIISALGMGD
jgi:hypothetical protein